MPADALLEAVGHRLQDGKLPLVGLFEIARQFDVSVEALTWRIHHVYSGKPKDKPRTLAMIERARAAAKHSRWQARRSAHRAGLPPRGAQAPTAAQRAFSVPHYTGAEHHVWGRREARRPSRRSGSSPHEARGAEHRRVGASPRRGRQSQSPAHSKGRQRLLRRRVVLLNPPRALISLSG